eukprot:6478223-Amphidinium_carterae.1
MTLATANGHLSVQQRVHVQLDHVRSTLDPLVLPDAPAVLSLGRLVIDDGYEFVRDQHSARLIMHDHSIELNVRSYVPILNPSQAGVRMRARAGGSIPKVRAPTPLASPRTWTSPQQVVKKVRLPNPVLPSLNLVTGGSVVALRITEDDDGLSMGTLENIKRWSTQKLQHGLAIHAWSSVPCTGGSHWQRINRLRYGADVADEHQRIAESLFLVWEQIVGHVASLGGTSSMEWPVQCDYWRWPAVKALVTSASYHKHVVKSCRVDLLSKRGQVLSKTSLIATNSASLSYVLQGLDQCDHQQQASCAGGETKRSGHYPVRFAIIIRRALLDSTFAAVARVAPPCGDAALRTQRLSRAYF